MNKKPHLGQTVIISEKSVLPHLIPLTCICNMDVKLFYWKGKTNSSHDHELLDYQDQQDISKGCCNCLQVTHKGSGYPNIAIRAGQKYRTDLCPLTDNIENRDSVRKAILLRYLSMHLEFAKGRQTSMLSSLFKSTKDLLESKSSQKKRSHNTEYSN